MNINQKNNFFKERREGRVIAFQSIFSFGFGEKKIEELLNLDWILEQVSKRSLEYAKYLVVGTISNIKEIDDIIIAIDTVINAYHEMGAFLENLINANFKDIVVFLNARREWS